MCGLRGLRGLCLIGVVAIAAAAWFAIVTAAVPHREPPVSREAIERDLRLYAVLDGSPVVSPGAWIKFAWTLTNTSRDQTHTIVLPGDGSEMGWREPSVFYAVERMDETGAWIVHPPHGYARCGNYDTNWSDEVHRLAPGGSAHLGEWAPSASLRFRFQEEGRYRITAQYAYRCRPSVNRYVKGAGASPTIPTDMLGVPAFTLSADPVELTVKRPY